MTVKHFWNGEWPNLNDISIHIQPSVLQRLSGEAVKAIYLITWQIASTGVHSWLSEPSDDPSIEGDLESLLMVCGLSEREWTAVRGEVEHQFRIGTDGRWRIKHASTVVIARPERRVTKSSKEIVNARQGKACAYCGRDDLALEYDHLFPHSRGGADDASNLVLACKPCNLSKGDKTLAEWMDSRQ